MNPHEEHFARSFILPEKRARYLSLLESKRGRKKLLDGLNHCHDLDERYAQLIPAGQQNAQAIEKVLKRKGAPEQCYVMSDDVDIDGKEMLLREALLKVVGSNMGTVISCVAGKLAYFEFEDMGERYLLER